LVIVSETILLILSALFSRFMLSRDLMTRARLSESM
jgi:hypothetical protein